MRLPFTLSPYILYISLSLSLSLLFLPPSLYLSFYLSLSLFSLSFSLAYLMDVFVLVYITWMSRIKIRGVINRNPRIRIHLNICEFYSYIWYLICTNFLQWNIGKCRKCTLMQGQHQKTKKHHIQCLIFTVLMPIKWKFYALFRNKICFINFQIQIKTFMWSIETSIR